MYKVKLTEFVNKMNLKSLLPDIDTDSIMIEQSAVNRLALQLAGFFEHFDSERIQVIGNVEAAYMKQLAPESIPPLCEKIFSFNIPCLVFCRGLEPSLEMLDTAEKNGVPIFTTEMTTSDFIANSVRWLSEELAPRISIHGVLVDVYGEGVLIMGESGIGKSEAALELIKRGHEGVGSDIQETYSGVADGSAVTKAPYVALDITDKEAVEKVITEVNPDAVIHCAAWTAVDMAEDDDKVAKVRAINAGGTQNIADVCKKLDCKMTYISTDYVFDGQGTEPWQPDCKDYKPLNVYGQTKLEGELAVSQTLEKYFIVRIAWVFGLNGKNFIKTMLNVGKTHDTVRVVKDQIGTPTYTYDLARLLVDMNETEKYGYYHATNEGGYISWYDFTKEIYRQAGYKTEVLPVSTEEYGLSKAARPFNSRLDKSKLVEAGFTPLPTWQDALSRYLKEIEQ